ncbi:T9SS type A sorting domain-containing protein [Aquimarina latercula]|uniref:T9SS type A sorting domain-containing protein n=1 Tax=Aquimarina latercula TaxID=987 RepID=UPI00040FAD30|nr:T9SS type A sorting domain-containing protein [Aquimarina latercula]
MAPKITQPFFLENRKKKQYHLDIFREKAFMLRSVMMLIALFLISSISAQNIENRTSCTISVDAGTDQVVCDGQMVTLTATSANQKECTSCVGYKIKNTKFCDRQENKYVVWLSDDNGDVKYLSNVDLEWKELGNEEATLKGMVTDGRDNYIVDVIFTNGTKTAPEGSPKEHWCNQENSSDWEYYKEFSGTIVKEDNSWSINLSRRGPAFQLGEGANITEKKKGRLGGSGWFDTNDSVYKIGDFNINIGPCNSSETTDEVNYLWSNGETTPSITVSESGTYTVSVEDCKGCNAMDSVEVVIEEFVIDAGEDQTIVEGNSMTLDPISDPEIDRREWSVDGVIFYTTVSPSRSPTVSPEQTTTYTVRAFKGECVYEDTVTITVEPCNFSIDLGDDRTICNNEPITITPIISGNDAGACTTFDVENTNFCSGINTYLVSLGNKQNRVYLVNENVQWEEVDDTTARMEGIAVNSQDANDTYQISVVFTQKTTIPPAESPRLHGCSSDVNADGWEYYPEFNGTITSLTTNDVINVSRRGPSFQVGKGANDTELVSGRAGGSGWFITDEDLYEIGDFNFNLGNCVVNGSMIYEWSTGENTASIQISEAGEYTVTVTNEDGCMATDSINVISNEVAIEAGEDQTILEGDSVTLIPVSGADLVQWSIDGNVFFSTGSPSASPTVSPTETTTYTVRARFGECIAEDMVVITVLSCDDIMIDAGNDRTIQEGESVRLNAISDVEYREWSVDGNVFFTTVSPSQAPIVSPIETTTYVVTATIGDCIIIDTITIFVEACDLSVDLGDDITICSGEDVDLTPIVTSTISEGDILNTTICTGDPQNYVLWLYNGQVNRYFSNIDLEWTELDNGTATLEGTILDYTVTNEVFNFEATFSGRTIVAAEGSPKPSICNEINSDGWEYYTNISGIISSTDGSWSTTFTRRGPAFQIGTGANSTEIESSANGASGWIQTTDSEYTIGDIDIVFSNGEVTYEWSTEETTSTISVSPTETTTYSVTITDENGCQATDEVLVTVEACDNIVENSIKVYPTIVDENNNQLTIELYSELDQNVNIELFNINGVRQNMSNQSLDKGDNMIYYSINQNNSIPTGIYLLRIIGKGVNETCRIVKR